MAWRFRWEDSGQDEFKAKLLAYNQADCNALRLLTSELQALSTEADKRADVDFTNKPKQLATARGEEIHRLFDGILASAHEEYKRKKIELSGLVVPQKHASQPAPVKKKIRRKTLTKPSKTIVVPRKRRCVDHPHVKLRLSRKMSEHRLVDLAFTKKGCHRRIVKYVGHMTYCPECNHVYSPPAIQRLCHNSTATISSRGLFTSESCFAYLFCHRSIFRRAFLRASWPQHHIGHCHTVCKEIHANRAPAPSQHSQKPVLPRR